MILDLTRMTDALRLTRAGKLAEATSLLQGLPPNPTPPANSEELERDPAKTAFRDGQLLDMVPPRSGSGAWTTPGVSIPQHSSLAAGLRQPGMPEALRGFLERLGVGGSSLGLRGISGGRVQDARTSLPDGARYEECTYTNAAGSRKYKLFVPSCYCGEPRPLIVMLHGCKQSPDDFATGTRMNELAEEQGFLVAYPGQPSSANPLKCWNWFSADDQLRGKGEPCLIAGITGQIMREFGVDSNSRLHRWALGGRGRGGHNGLGVSRSIRGNRRPFRACLRGRKGPQLGLLGDAARRVTAAAGRSKTNAADDRVSRRPR